MSEKWRDRSIASVEWSVRTWNALRESGHRTLGELADVGDNALLITVRNFGRRSLAEVRDVIRSVAGEEHGADDAYERGRAAGRAEERTDIVAWLREQSAKAGDKAKYYAAKGDGRLAALLLHSSECVETVAFGIDAGSHAKAPAEGEP